jgi:hypothetical protein
VTHPAAAGRAAFGVAVALFVVAGVVVGTAWWWWSPDVTAVSTGSGVVVVGPDPESAIAVDAWFVGLTVPVVLVAAWLVRRRWRDRPALGALLVAIGGLVFTATVAIVGGAWGPPLDPAAPRGEQVDAPLVIGGPAWLLVAPSAGLAGWFVADLLIGLGLRRDPVAGPGHHD